MSKILEQRKELLYIYDASYCNPNGDPSDENKPRTDPVTQYNLVSDVRLKRTIRDYLYDIKNQEIFVMATANKEGIVPDAKTRASEYMVSPEKGESLQEVKNKIDANIIERCIDIRLFGATIPLDIPLKNAKGKVTKTTGSIVHTGAVQFKMGKSFHQVSIERIKGTGAFASGPNKRQQSFRTEYIIPYSLIGFHGIINEHRASEVKLADEDVEMLYDAIWNGTKHMITRTKFGLTPRLLFVITYVKDNFQISDLDKKIKLVSDKSDFELRSFNDYTLIVDDLFTTLVKHKTKIESIAIAIEESVEYKYQEEILKTYTDFQNALTKLGFEVTDLDLD